MRRTTGSVLAALAVLVFAGVTFAGVQKATSLDGKSFEVQLVKDGSTGGTPDTLSFDDGMFDSSACHPYGFGKSTYTAKSSEDAISFQVHATSKDNKSEEIWNGVVRGEQIHGTVKMTDPKGTVTRYKFTGKMVTT